MIPAHVSLSEEILTGGDALRAQLQKAVDENAIGPVYEQHPKVLEAISQGQTPWPWAIYIDGISFQDRDSLIGFWVFNIVTRTRHLAAALRSSELCGCGCRGWCSFFVVWSMLAWSAKACLDSIWPTSRPYGVPWGEGRDGVWSSLAGQALGFVAVLLYIKCDLKEVSASLGLPALGSLRAPCPVCCCGRHNWSDMSGLSPLEHEWGCPRWNGTWWR